LSFNDKIQIVNIVHTTSLFGHSIMSKNSSNCHQKFTHNDLRANEGRETEALNCKPNTNLKEKSEVSNYCKPAAFVCTLL